MFCCGLILHTNGNKNRQNFEVQLNMLRMMLPSQPEETASDPDSGKNDPLSH